MVDRLNYEKAEKLLDVAIKTYATIIKDHERWASNPKKYFIDLDISKKAVEKATANATKVFWEKCGV